MSKHQDNNIRAIGYAFINYDDVDMLYIKNDGLKLKLKHDPDYATVEYVKDCIFVEVKIKKQDMMYMHLCHHGVDEAIEFIKGLMFNEG